MVRLLLNKESNSDNNNNTPITSSKSSKKKIIIHNAPTTLNPFCDDNNNTISSTISSTIINDTSSLEFCNIYKPICSNDLIGLDVSYYYLKTWYNNSLTNLNNPFLVIIGEVGCGKTSLVNIFCKENDIILFDLNNSINIDDDIKSFIYQNSISQFYNNKLLKKLILIDNYKSNSSDIISINRINELFVERGTNKLIPPIVIICGENKGSKLSKIKKNYIFHYINDINLNLIKQWVSTIIKNHKINLSNEEIDLLLHNCKGDKQFLLNTLNFIKEKKNLIINSYKDFNNDNFKTINKLFDNIEPLDIHKIYKIYDTDGYLLANLVHENYLDFNNDIDSISESAEHISNGEFIMNSLYTSEKIFQPLFHCIESIVFPGYYSRCDVKINKVPLRATVINNRYNILLNNKKIIDKLQLDIYDILIYKTFLNDTLIKSKKINENQDEYLYKLLTLFNNDINVLELIYKHFNNSFGNVSKNTLFTKKFKEKLLILIKNKEY